MRSRSILLLCLLLPFVLGTECDEPLPIDTYDPIVVEVVPASAEMDVLDTLRFHAIVSGGTQDQRVDWSSSTPDVASVDQHGLVTAHEVGVASIVATSVVDDVAKQAAAVLVGSGEAPGSIVGAVSIAGGDEGGTPLSDVTMRIEGPQSRVQATNAFGQAFFPEVPDGEYTVSISGYPPGVTFPQTSQTISVQGDEVIVVFVGTPQS